MIKLNLCPTIKTFLLNILLFTNVYAFQGEIDLQAFSRIDSVIEASMERYSIPGLFELNRRKGQFQIYERPVALLVDEDTFSFGEFLYWPCSLLKM